MGHAEIIQDRLIIHSHIITYGNAADEEITERIRREIEMLWNEPQGKVLLRSGLFTVSFRITAAFHQSITPEEIFDNTDPRNNYFRIEEYALGNISFVDGIGCNTGYFKKDNLYEGSTTAAHEYGHTLGLVHPHELDIRGKGTPGIMYPRGTVVDAAFQYNAAARAGDNTNGGTMHPGFRRVSQGDIDLLKLPKKMGRQLSAVIGDFTSIWHPDHAALT